MPRAKTISFFEDLRERSLIAIEEAKQSGRKIFGLYCIFVPKELIRAAGGIPIGLCGKDQSSIKYAEDVLPANLCPLIKSSYGYAISGTCPYFESSDFIVGETTCDGKKKMFELLKEIKPLYLLHLPPTSNENHSLDYWYKEIMDFKDFLEKNTGVRITNKSLIEQIKIHNKKRKLLKKLISYCTGFPIPISGLDMMVVMEAKNFCVDLNAYIESLEKLIQEMEIIKKEKGSVCSSGAPRILVTGCPIGKGSEKVIRLIEECGGIVVCQENCTTIKSFYHLVDEKKSDPYKAIAMRYLNNPCSCITPNNLRIKLLEYLIEEFKIQAVVDLTWQFCHTYNIESYHIKRLVQRRYKLPFIHIETDYSNSDIAQLKTRIEAFLEMLQ